MIPFLLAAYLKLNLLLMMAFLVWTAVKIFMRLVSLETSQAQQLKAVRYGFMGLLFMTPVLLLLNSWLPGWSGGVTSVPGIITLDGLTVRAGLDDMLAQQLIPGSEFGVIFVVLAVFLAAGFAFRLSKLVCQVASLRRIIGGSVEWKIIGNIQVLFSPSISTPFSTRALGHNHVVLPYQLLRSPRNLRLAVKHELQHLRSGDLDWVILLEAVKLLCFWNPAVYLWHNEFDCLQELACDEALIRNRQVNPQAYGSCLLEVASAGRSNGFVAASNMVPKFSLLKNHNSQLKRRIIMLANNSNKKYAAPKALVYGLLISAGFITSTVVVFAAAGEPDAAQPNPSIIPVTRVNPEYPLEALEQKLVGWVQVQFDIDESGNVLAPFVVANCVRPVTAEASDCVPDDMFDATTLAAIARWKYTPGSASGSDGKGLQTLLRYEFASESEAAEEAAQ